METFSAVLALCEGDPSVTSGFLSQRPVTRSFDVFFDLRLNKRLDKRLRRRWFEIPSRPLGRHCNVIYPFNNAPLLKETHDENKANKRLNKRLRRWWFEIPSRSLGRHCNVIFPFNNAPLLRETHEENKARGHSLHYWPFIRRIHRSLKYFLTKIINAEIWCILYCYHEQAFKQSRDETLWRPCDVI